MDVTVRLANDELWTKFHAHTTEMVVTKTGRKMFPKLEYIIEGLKTSQAYGLVLQIEQVDDNRYKFSGGEWSAAGRGETGSVAKNVMHHDGVMPGAHWMRQPVNFERVKITNNPNDTNPSHIFLQSMHKYIPVLTIFEIAQSETPFMSASTSQPPKQIARIRMPETEFIAVTAYQNSTITQLKIEHNPFAKGFRDGGERKRASPESCTATPSPKRIYSPSNYTSPMDKPVTVPVLPNPAPMPIPPMWPGFYPAYWNPYSYMLNPLLARFGAAPK
ncbi:hypothetical protein Y032_0091g2475 [Ancylostoma ceylanicum]|uniref:T-box domain-containing protein n=2 Tax=Ancylostoma ceylanicum TaxID=53326 RepID=A0A016TME9_9BILA|nr:hypothetical protein Y032_0091g2475 [Ancylostoma ceylanicum]